MDNKVSQEQSYIKKKQTLQTVLIPLAIVLLSFVLGLAANHFSPKGIPVFAKAADRNPFMPPGIQQIDLIQARAIVDLKSMPILDARLPEQYATGHIPGALNLPVEEFENYFLDRADILTGASEVLVYCEGENCGQGIALAERLKEAFKGKILLFRQGWHEWLAAGYPKELVIKPKRDEARN